ncbi:DUF1932 domain-containing protein [Leifsonia xyli]|uniref:NAD(P)-dependent oxidoreductase n=1 Tax=Leifsonia xyli TaxID=1575 RepID=UPI003D675722
MKDMVKVGVIGLGEAGSLIAEGLKNAGAAVIGFDTSRPIDSTVVVAADLGEAVRGSDVVLSINSATAARSVAREAALLIEPTAVFADLNTGTPALKASLAELFGPGIFADVAIMKPVPGLAEKVPMAVAGPGARRFLELMAPLGLNLEYVSPDPGAAAARKLLRSILAKGTAAVLIDYLWAAERLGLEDWAYEELLSDFDSHTADTAKRYLEGTAKHVKRRQIEMMDVTEMLAEIGYQSTMVDGVALTYSRILHSTRIPHSR